MLNLTEEFFGDSPGKKRGPGELVAFQGSHLLSSRTVHPDVEEAN